MIIQTLLQHKYKLDQVVDKSNTLDSITIISKMLHHIS